MPDDPKVAFCRALGLAEVDSPEHGVQYLNDFVSAHSEDPNALQTQINFLEDFDRDDQAFDALQKGIELFPGEPRFRVALMEHASYMDDDELAVLERQLGEKAESPVERLALCSILHEAAIESSLSAGCFNRLWKDLVDRGVEGEKSEAMELVRDRVLEVAMDEDDSAWTFEILSSLRGEEASYGWRRVLGPGEAGRKGCEGFLHAYLSGKLQEALVGLSLEEGAWQSLSSNLASCGFRTEAEQVRNIALPRLSSQALEDGVTYQVVRSELRRRFEMTVPDGEVARIIGENPDLFPNAPREKVLRAWAATSVTTRPRLLLAELLKEELRYGEAEAALLEAVALEPRNLDLQLRVAGLALLQGVHEQASVLVHGVLRDRQASQRQHSIGLYLLGRAARRQGRFEEASTHLEAYFLRRFEFSGCCEPGTDIGLVAHLWQTAAPERLAAYLEAKAEALATFARTSTPDGPFAKCAELSCSLNQPLRSGMDQVYRSLAEQGSQEESVLEWVEKREARNNRWKTADPEALFEDDLVLGFDPASLGFSHRISISTNCFFPDYLALLGERYDPRSSSCPW